MFTDFREEGRERNKDVRDMDVREKHWSVSSGLYSDRGLNLQFRHVPGWESNPQPFGVWDEAPTNWATKTAQE